MAIAVGQFTIVDFNDVNIDTIAPANPVTNQLWLDSSVVPNQLKRWNGTAWINATPTTAGEVGAYSASDGSNLATRVTTAESKITPEAITATVESKTAVLATKSEVTQTATGIRAEIGAITIGARNLLLKSNVAVTNNAYLISSYNLAEPMKAGKVYTMRIWGSLGAGKSSFTPYNPSAMYPLTNLIDKGDGTYASTFVCRPEVDGITKILIYTLTSGVTVNSTITKIKLEEGNKATEWNPAQEEIYSGLIEVDRDGVKVGRSGESLETKIGYDGLRIIDGSTEIASFTDAGAVIDNLFATYIRGNVFNINRVDLAFDIGIGKAYSSVAQVLSILDKMTFAMDNKYISFNLYGEISENIILRNFHGSGNVYVQFVNGARLNGNIRTYKNTTPISFFSSGTGRGAVVGGDPIVCDGDSYIRIDTINIKGTGGGNGIYSKDGANVFVLNCDISNVSTGMRCEGGAQLVSWNNIGTCSSTAFNVQWGARLYYSGQYPYYSQSLIYQANAGMFWVQGATSMVVSAYNPPPVVDTTFVNTFNPTKIQTWNMTEGFVSTYYGSAGAQNRWDSSTGFMKGQITFGADVYNYIADRKAGSTPTVQIRLKRKDSTHGTSSGVAPTPYNFTPNTGFNTATRGAWTGWVTIPYTLITSTGYTFEFYNGTTGLTYAIWDAAEVQVTKVKSV